MQDAFRLLACAPTIDAIRAAFAAARVPVDDAECAALERTLKRMQPDGATSSADASGDASSHAKPVDAQAALDTFTGALRCHA